MQWRLECWETEYRAWPVERGCHGQLCVFVAAAAAGVPAAGAHLTHSIAPHLLLMYYTIPWLTASGCLREKQWCYGVNWVVPLIRVAETNNCDMGRNKIAPKDALL